VADEDALRRPGWALPASSVVLGLLAIPLMFVAPMSFVIGLAVATAATIAGVVAAQDADRCKAQRLIGAVACLSVPAALAFLTVPSVFQD
jgi:hypothetical protein